jgi:hypothetical protein
MIERGMAFKPVRISKPCVLLDEAVDRKESEERNKMLAPLSNP